MGEWNLGQFWNITSGIYVKYHVVFEIKMPNIKWYLCQISRTRETKTQNISNWSTLLRFCKIPSIISWKISQSRLNTSASMWKNNKRNHCFESLALRWVFAFSPFRRKRELVLSCAQDILQGSSTQFYEFININFHVHPLNFTCSEDRQNSSWFLRSTQWLTVFHLFLI